VTPGKFITFEGPDGAGKSTQAQRFIDFIRLAGVPVCNTREPGGTPFGERLRGILLAQPFPSEPLAEVFLFEAIRAEHVTAVIKPALDAGETVVCDRFIDTSEAYQGYARGTQPTIVRTLNDIATRGLYPDLTVFLDADIEQGLRDARSRRLSSGKLDRIEAAGLEFHRAARAGYQTIVKREPGRFVVVQRRDSKDETASDILNGVWQRLPDLFRQQRGPKIIGFAGRMRAGKDTACDALARVLGDDAVRFSFSTAVKEEALRRDPLLSREDVFEKKPRAIREFLVRIGEDLREPDPHIWIKPLVELWKSLPPEKTILVDAVRFPNDADMVRVLGGAVYHVVRPENDVPNMDAPSENLMEQYKHFDGVLINTGPVEGFQACVLREIGIPDQGREV
jgi:dTMP kinase